VLHVLAAVIVLCCGVCTAKSPTKNGAWYDPQHVLAAVVVLCCCVQIRVLYFPLDLATILLCIVLLQTEHHRNASVFAPHFLLLVSL
jgi:hypothetical protein